jgi:hypothetical protein
MTYLADEFLDGFYPIIKLVVAYKETAFWRLEMGAGIKS